MNREITISSTALIIMISSFSPFVLNQAQGQILYPCPNGYQHNSLGLCTPIISSSPNLQECPVGYIKSHSGVCELVGSSSETLSNATNQTLNQGSSLVQQPPNTAETEPLQQLQPLQQQPQPPPAQQQQWSTYQDPSGIFAISYPSNWIPTPGNDGGIMF
jgi:hypothetical protein